MKKEMPNSPDFIIKRIKPLNLFIDESGLPANATYRVELKHKISANIPFNIVSLEIEVIFVFNNDDEDNKRIVLDCTVQNVFEIENLSDFVNGENNMILPNDTIITFVSLSVSHTRAIMAMLTAGTFFQENLLKVINPVELAKAFFPDAPEKPQFEAEEKQGKKRRKFGNTNVSPNPKGLNILTK